MFDRIKTLLERWHEIREVETMSDRDIEDLGLTRDQLAHFVRMPSDIEDRVTHMAAVFGLSEVEVSANHAQWVELLEVCGGCTDRVACAHVLAKGADAHPADCSFCRNRASFEALTHPA